MGGMHSVDRAAAVSDRRRYLRYLAAAREGAVQKAFGIVWLAYLVAGLVAVAKGLGAEAWGWHPLAVALAADVAATVVIFAVQLPVQELELLRSLLERRAAGHRALLRLRPASEGVDGLRVTSWSSRSCSRGPCGSPGTGRAAGRGSATRTGATVRLQEQSGRAYWLVSFAGIHLMPTLWVFARLPVLVSRAGARRRGRSACSTPSRRCVTAGSIWIEKRADDELLRFRAAGHGPHAILKTGLWAWSRHPNYFGEMGFWWGLWLFGLAADPAWWWTIVGPRLDHADVPLREPADGRDAHARAPARLRGARADARRS